MAQLLKDCIAQRIAKAGLEVFARRGFRRATMAEIARTAGVSTGNIYRYYRNKTDLFDRVVDDRFVSRFVALLRARIKALDGVRDASALGPGASYHVAAEALLGLAFEDRLKLVVLLDRADGTRLHGINDRLLRDMTRQALAWARGVRPTLRVTPALRLSLDRIYRNWARTLVSMLEQSDSEAQLRTAVDNFSKYHLSGLRALLT